MSVFAQGGAYDYDMFSTNNIVLYNPEDSGCDATTGVATGQPNKDYLGRDILTAAQLAAILSNQSTYEQAAKQASIPWQMLAVVHLRESGLRKENPGNGQGIYQDAAKVNGPYPPGAVTDAEFLRQSVWAANFLKGKSSDVSGLASGTEGAVKDSFFGYNGRAGAYVTQARTLGYTNSYEGSPYVMNQADAKRDPASNPTGWGQIKTDGGPLVYPANTGYGAFVMYASIAGLPTSACAPAAATGTGTCTTGTDLRTKLVACAQQELALWKAGTMKPGYRKNDPSSFSKYSYNVSTDWCAYFISWALKQSGKPLDGANDAWPSVGTFLTRSATQGFKVHARGDGYKPQPGDFAIYGAHEHINMVVGYSGSTMITIGGNQPSHNGTAASYLTNSITQNSGYGSSATYYVQVVQ